MPAFQVHPLRYALANELRPRPFATVDGAQDKAAEHAHHIDLLDRHGAPHPQPHAKHSSGQLGRHLLKKESHTEFVT